MPAASRSALIEAATAAWVASSSWSMATSGIFPSGQAWVSSVRASAGSWRQRAPQASAVRRPPGAAGLERDEAGVARAQLVPVTQSVYGYLGDERRAGVPHPGREGREGLVGALDQDGGVGGLDAGEGGGDPAGVKRVEAADR